MEIERLKSKVLDKYAPSEAEILELENTFEELSDYIISNYDLETHFAGSASRGTCLSGDNDIDLFVLFPEDNSRDELETKGLEIGESVFDTFGGEYEVEYAEHPYTRGVIDGNKVEIVPCYDVKPGKIRSSVDRTPHHSRWVKENLSESQRQDVIVLKKFLDVAGIYGSSLKTRGFSGYLCEILIHEYGGFRELVEEAPDWNRREHIDPESHHGAELPAKLEEKFEQDSLVVIDPVDPERNVASVLSDQNYARFVYLSWEFVNSPSMKYFESSKKEVTEFEIKKELDSRSDILVISFEAPEEVEDIVYPQMRKTLRSIERELEENDFRIYEKGFYIGEKARLIFEVDDELPEVQYVRGPKVFHNKEHIEQFQTKYSDVFIRDDRLCAKTHREYKNAKDLLQDCMIRARDIGVPENISELMKDARFSDPIEGSNEWLKYLADKLQV